LETIQLGSWIIQTIAMLLTALLIPGLRVTSIFGALLCVVALAFVNAHLWSAALFFHVPMELSIHALMLLLANGVIFWIIVKILPGIEVSGIIPALVAPIAFTLIAVVIQLYLGEVEWGPVVEATLERISNLRDFFLSGVETSSPTETTEDAR